MKRALLLLLLLPLVAGNAFMDDFLRALQTGNYSLIEPYLGDELREQLTPEAFEGLRELVTESCGEPLSYRLVNDTYVVSCTGGSFTVNLNYENGTLVGIAVSVKEQNFLATVLGSIAFLLLVLPFKRPGPEVFLSAGVALPLSLLAIVPGPAGLLLTAFVTESAKYYLSRRGDGFSVGLGFGLGNYILLPIGTFVTANFIMGVPVYHLGSGYVAFAVAFVMTAFHAFTGAAYDRWGAKVLVPFALLEAVALLNFGGAVLTTILLGGMLYGSGRKTP